MACYIDGLLPEVEVRQMEKHLLKCNRCREIVEVIRKVISQEKSNSSVVSSPVVCYGAVKRKK